MNFLSFKEELKRQNDESINSTITKIRLDNSARHSFKSKGNKEQYNHQEKVDTHFESAIESFHSKKILEVRNALEEGKNLVATCMKHIVLTNLQTDSFSWGQVQRQEDSQGSKRWGKSKGEEKEGQG